MENCSLLYNILNIHNSPEDIGEIAVRKMKMAPFFRSFYSRIFSDAQIYVEI